ncbi:MAG: ABC transporter substrate-binding protein, partial [Dehalococcoidia bacterium]|nr:ABC transporter substrate-binding protein [Dehalococcoidia bacterium]
IFANLTPAAGSSGSWYFYPFYDSMTTFGANFELRPAVLTRWEMSADRMRWLVTVREGMRWHDGTPLTAEDVAFSYNMYIRTPWPARSFIANVTGARAIDARTVELALRVPDASIPAGSAYLWVVPQHYLERVGFDGFVQRPMGSGPYDLVEFTPGDFIRYRKRSEPHAFRTPIATELVFRALPENSQKINGLRNGDYDIITWTSLTADQIDLLRRMDMQIIADPSANWSITFPQVAYETRNTPLRDRRVRLALNYAVDKEAMANSLFRGFAKPSPQQYAAPNSPYWDPSVPVIPYNPAEARRLLAEAGYPNGFALPYGVDNAPAQSPMEPLLAVQGYLREIGVDMPVHSLEWSAILAKARGQGPLIGDMWAQGNTDATGFASGIRTFWGCGRPTPQSVWYCNPEFDRLMDLALAEPDPQRRQQLFWQANRVWREDVPMLYLLIQPTFHILSPKVRGWTLLNTTVFNFDDAYKIN